MAEYFYGTARKAPRPAVPLLSRPPGTRGVGALGRIVKLFVGQSYGFIRVADDREIFFHRSDVRHGMSFNDFVVGDVVVFELLEDAVSGARALRVGRRPHR